ncbi:MrcB family domain-containing protein [Paenibacillus chitinolyticus]|uniref:MrcB family domain-containing protein n=1 Tax=Paenibacillus chitinolyticus TaxID=79263 RepID=UPI0035DB8A33
MTLPSELSSIFRHKQKSYKIILILSMLEEYRNSQQQLLSFGQVAERFLSYYRTNEDRGNKVDIPPGGAAARWSNFSLTQTKSLLNTPLNALSAILDFNNEQQTITFKELVWNHLNEQGLEELKQYAEKELEQYNLQLRTNFSLRQALEDTLNTYTAAKNEPFANHALGTLFRRTIPEYINSQPFINENYKVQGSIGQGNWVTIPWIAILDKRITEKIQSGEYITYLFSADMTSVYLTLMQGVDNPLKERGRKEGHRYLAQKVQELRGLLPLEGMQKDNNMFLAPSGLGRDYQVSTVAYIRYDKDHLPEEDQLLADLENVMNNYKLYVDHVVGQTAEVGEELVEEFELPIPTDTLTVPERIGQIKSYIEQKGFHYPGALIENLYLSFKTKPFVILAGVSGTGKTKLVKLFAEAIGAIRENNQYTLIPVRPDWSDPSDLLGYKDLSGAFRPGRLAKVLVEASKEENRHKPYFICLDEMNLARVEHYFSDLLSIIETQKWQEERIVTSPLIQAEELGTEDQSVYGGLALPDNVYLVGTVNMDETTHPFSKKVLDRANTIEFNYINLMQYPGYEDLGEGAAIVPASNGFLRADYLQLVEAYPNYPELIQRTTEKLVTINEILEDIHSQVGFRIRDAVCFYMVYNQRFELLSENDAFDWQLLQKILPRVQGSSSSVKRALLGLMQVAVGKPLNMGALIDDASELTRKWGSRQSTEVAPYPQSARKIAFMIRRLEEDGFTSFWLS